MIDEHEVVRAAEPPSATAGAREWTPASAAAVVVAVVAVAVAAGGALATGTALAWCGFAAVAAWSVAAGVVAVLRRDVPLGLVTALVPMSVAVVVATAAHANSDLGGAIRGLAVAASAVSVAQLFVHAPNGSVGSSGARRAAWMIDAVGVVLAVVLVIGAPDVAPAPVVVVAAVLALVALSGFVATCRRASVVERARLQWIGWGVVVAVAVIGIVAGTHALTDRPAALAPAIVVATCLAAVGVAASAVAALLGHVGTVVVHTIVGLGLLVFVAVVYVVIVVGFYGMPEDGETTVLALSLVAAVVVAVTGVAVHRRLRSFAHRRVFGDEDDPAAALHGFATRMSRAIPMDELLLQLVESLRATMRLSSAEVWTGADGQYHLAVSVPHRPPAQLAIGGSSLSVASRAHVQGNAWLAVWVPDLLEGRADRAVRFTSVTHLGELLGFIVTERPAAEVALDEDDEHQVLVDIARQLGLALHNLRLDNALQASLDDLRAANHELAASRARLVSMADESRRRIERNLHDGAQQHLVAMAVKVGLVRQLLDSDRDVAASMVDELRHDVQATLTELRELAHGVYPPLLRERGLGEALRAAANRSVLPATVTADGIGRYGPDVESAVYFCCLEAMQNAGKHAGAEATLEVSVREGEGVLEFEVRDDGAGFDVDAARDGSGFVNMRDRLGAFGGVLEVTSVPGAGAVVRGWVPLG